MAIIADEVKTVGLFCSKNSLCLPLWSFEMAGLLNVNEQRLTKRNEIFQLSNERLNRMRSRKV